MHPVTDNKLALTALLAGLTLAVMPVGASAADPGAVDAVTTNSNPSPNPSIATLKPLDRHQETISQAVTGFANWLDGFFGSERIYEESQGSYLQINLVRAQQQGEAPLYSAVARGKLVLPNTQDRFNLLLESSNDDDIADATAALDIPQGESIEDAVDSQRQSVGLRYIPFFDEHWRLSTDAGVRFDGGLDPFTRLRIRRTDPLGSWTLRLAETLFWYRSRGAGESTALEADRLLAERLLFRYAASATWLNDNRYFDLAHDLLLFQTLDNFAALRYQAGLRDTTKSDARDRVYFLTVAYRRNIHEDWLYLEIRPRIHYPEAEDFRHENSLTISIEAIFGEP